MPPHALRTSALLATLLLAACVQLGEVPPDDPSSASNGDGKGDDGGGTEANPVPPSASASATVTGCGRHSATFSPDWEAVSVLFEDASTEPARPLSCQVTLDYVFDAGWTFALPHVDARGFAAVDEGARLELVVAAQAPGARDEARHTATGPTDDDFVFRMDGGGAAVACGATSARVVIDLGAETAGAAAAFGVVDSLDAALDWQRCD